jgi:hypothetical protein
MTKDTKKLITHLESIGYKEYYEGENLIMLQNAEKEIFVGVDTALGIFKIQPQKIMQTNAAVLPIKTISQLSIILSLVEKLPENVLSEAQYSL